MVADEIANKTGLTFISAENKFAQLAAHDAVVAERGTKYISS
jgi:fumarate hydratase class II